ncbi:MAG: DUF305 domain-containing protein [Actinobacteria bacterium]|nr:DUF305 domain-containing protein [Actinomycetota bacterium]
MRINTANNSAFFKRAIAGLVALIMVMALAGCSKDGSMGMDHEGHSAGASGELSSDDIMFLQMMIPHHQQAIDISDLALTISADPELLTLAKDIRDGQAAEIVKMKAWLDAAGADLDPGHSMGHGMDGMLSDSELADLKAARGKSFDLLWLKGMTGHHDGAIDMTAMIENAKNAEIKSFGEGIVASQSAQNKAMAAMIKRIG